MDYRTFVQNLSTQSSEYLNAVYLETQKKPVFFNKGPYGLKEKLDQKELNELSAEIKSVLDKKLFINQNAMTDDDEAAEPIRTGKRKADTETLYVSHKSQKPQIVQGADRLQSIFDTDSSSKVSKTFKKHDDFFGMHKLMSGHMVPNIKKKQKGSELLDRVNKTIETTFTEALDNFEADGEKALLETIKTKVSRLNDFQKCLGYSVCYQVLQNIMDSDKSLLDLVYTNTVPFGMVWESMLKVGLLSGDISSDMYELNNLKTLVGKSNGSAINMLCFEVSGIDYTACSSQVDDLIDSLDKYNSQTRMITLSLRDKGQLFERYCIPYSVILAGVNDLDIATFLKSTADINGLLQKVGEKISIKYEQQGMLDAWYGYAQNEEFVDFLSVSKDHQLEVFYYYLGHATGALQDFFNKTSKQENELSKFLKTSLSFAKNNKQLSTEDIAYIDELIDEPKKSRRQIKKLKPKLIEKILISRMISLGLGVNGEVGDRLEKVQKKKNLPTFAIESSLKPYFNCSVQATGRKKRKAFKLVRKRVSLSKYCNTAFERETFFKWKTQQLVDVSLVAKLLVEDLIPLQTSYSRSSTHIIKIGKLPVHCFPILLATNDLPSVNDSRDLDEYLYRNPQLFKPTAKGKTQQKIAMLRKVYAVLKVISKQNIKIVKQTSQLDCVFRGVVGSISDESFIRLMKQVDLSDQIVHKFNRSRTSLVPSKALSVLHKTLHETTGLVLKLAGLSLDKTPTKDYLSLSVVALGFIDSLRKLTLQSSKKFVDLECSLFDTNVMQRLTNSVSIILEHSNDTSPTKLEAYLKLLRNGMSTENLKEIQTTWDGFYKQLTIVSNYISSLDELVDKLTSTIFTPCLHEVNDVYLEALPHIVIESEDALVGEDMFSMEELSQLACCSSCDHKPVGSECESEEEEEDQCGSEIEDCGDELVGEEDDDETYCGDELVGEEEDYLDEPEYCGSEFETLILDDKSVATTINGVSSHSKINNMNFAVANNLDTSAYLY